jgi:hypothetical protein
VLNSSILARGPTGRVKSNSAGRNFYFNGGTPVFANGALAVSTDPPLVYLAGMPYTVSGRLSVIYTASSTPFFEDAPFDLVRTAGYYQVLASLTAPIDFFTSALPLSAERSLCLI